LSPSLQHTRKTAALIGTGGASGGDQRVQELLVALVRVTYDTVHQVEVADPEHDPRDVGGINAVGGVWVFMAGRSRRSPGADRPTGRCGQPAGQTGLVVGRVTRDVVAVGGGVLRWVQDRG